MYLPHRAAGKVIYTGTHDNDTTVGWFRAGAAEHERRNAEAYLGRCDDGIHWAFIRAAQTSAAEFALIPLQDVLGLGSEARMNTPSLHGGNWKWRFAPGQFTAELTAKLAHLAEVTDRLPQAVSCPVGGRLRGLKSSCFAKSRRDPSAPLRAGCRRYNKIVYRCNGEFSWRQNPLSKRGRLRSPIRSRTGRAFRWWGSRTLPSSRGKSLLCWGLPAAASLRCCAF